MSAKQRVLQAVRALPANSTMDQIADEIAILAAIERGDENIAAGRTMTHEEVVKRSAAAWQSIKNLLKKRPIQSGDRLYTRDELHERR